MLQAATQGTEPSVRAAGAYRVQNQGHGAQDLVPCARDGNQALGVAGSQLRQRLHTDGGAGVLHEVANGLPLLADDSTAQLAGDSKLNLRARNTAALLDSSYSSAH